MVEDQREIRRRWKALRPFLSDKSTHPHIPIALVKQIDRCVDEYRMNRAIHKIVGDPDRVIPAIDKMFATATKITGLDPDEILRRTDFHTKDTAPNRIESAFAEVRSINFLHVEGFIGITPLRASDERQADIVAVRKGATYAVEVANSIYDARGRYTPEQMTAWLVGRFVSESKTAQIEKTAQARGAAKRVLVGIVDTEAPVALQTNHAFAEAARLGWNRLGADPSTHLCFVTGRETLGDGRDDAVHPSWE